MWELELRISPWLDIKDECIVKLYCKIVNRKISTRYLVGGGLSYWLATTCEGFLLRLVGEQVK